MSDRKQNPNQNNGRFNRRRGQRPRPYPKRPTAQQRRAQSQRDKARSSMAPGDSKLTSAPVAKSRTFRNSKPKIQTLPNGDCIITHREYVMDIVAGTGAPSPFNVQRLPVNPGQKSTFQWLSRVASNYESYQFNSLSFDYETEASTSLGGTLLLALDYDAADPAPISKQQAMAYRGSVRSAPWTACEHRSLAEDLAKSKTNFVRIGAQPADTDIKTYDIGNLFIISQGVSTSAAALGELYVSYSVRLMTPVFETVTDLVPVGGTADGEGALSAANPFGNGIAQLQPLASGFSVDSLSNLTFTTAGYYLVNLTLNGTVITASTFTPAGPNIVINPFIGDVINAAGTSLISILVIQVNQPGVVAVTATATTITNSSIYIASAPLGSFP